MHFSKRASAPAMPKWSRLKKKKPTFRVSPAPFPTLSMGFFKQTDTIIVSRLKAVRKRSPSQGYGAAVNINRCGNVASARSARDPPIPLNSAPPAFPRKNVLKGSSALRSNFMADLDIMMLSGAKKFAERNGFC